MQDFDLPKLVRQVICRGSQELLYYSATKRGIVGARARLSLVTEDYPGTDVPVF